MAALSTAQLAALVDGTLQGDATRTIVDVAAFDDAGPQHITYVDDSTKTLILADVGAILVSPKLAAKTEAGDVPVIVVDDPQMAFITAMLHFRPPTPMPCIGISPLAHVDPSATFGEQCHVFPGATVGANVTCGTGCVIHPGAFIGDGCRLGDDVTVQANAVMYSGMVIGNRVLIHSAAVIGADGFGYRFAEGRFHKIPHTGNVVLEDDVEIGAGTTIDRAMIGTTVIGEGTKLDNQVQIGHNCRIGKHNAFAGQVGIAGSTSSGDYVRCGGQAGIADHSHLGTGCSIGARAGLFGNVPEGVEYHGTPAGPAKEQIRIVMTLQKLPEMRRQLQRLEKEVTHLRTLLAQAAGAAHDDDQTQTPAAA